MTQQTKRLSSELRGFLERFTNIIFSNPFSFDTRQIKRDLGFAVKRGSSAEHHYSCLVPVLDERLQTLAKQNITRVDQLHDTDRGLVRYAWLFQYYDRYSAAFDALIEDQLVQGEKPVQVAFADELLQHFEYRGLEEKEGLRYLELFYQLRRAHYFISKSLVGKSKSMTRLRHALWNNVFTADVRYYADHLWDRMEDFSTLLLGETGTGKGSASAAIGRSGLNPFDKRQRRFKHSFMATYIATNLSQFPENLIESELFGHRKGAFTGAIDNHKGLFQRCSQNGALFLDEIGDVSVPVQIKLLNVLQDRQFSPVGSHETLRFAGRVIAATNKSLDQLRASGEFRDDFYFRLSSDVIEVPTLRQRLAERPEELSEMINVMVSRLTGIDDETLARRVHNKIRQSVPADYAWPGNVRELEQAIRRIVLNGVYQPEPARKTKGSWIEGMVDSELKAKELVSVYCQALYERYDTYEKVAERTGLNWRTVRKYQKNWAV